MRKALETTCSPCALCTQKGSDSVLGLGWGEGRQEQVGSSFPRKRPHPRELFLRSSFLQALGMWSGKLRQIPKGSSTGGRDEEGLCVLCLRRFGSPVMESRVAQSETLRHLTLAQASWPHHCLTEQALLGALASIVA